MTVSQAPSSDGPWDVTGRGGGLARVVAALIGRARGHWPILLVLALYAGSAVIVPTWTSAPVSDDWVYSRSVEILVREHHLEIFDLAVVTLVVQIIWGALFALVFDVSFGALRLSTVTLMALSGIALFELCRELGVSKGRSALGAAVYLFNPLAYVLAFTFMSDPHFTAWLVIASYWSVRGVRPNRDGARSMLIGSACAAFAFLTRQQGALIPLAVTIALLLSRRLQPNRTGIVLVARVVAIPATATILYYLWLREVHGVPTQQDSFLRSVTDAGWGGTWGLFKQMTFIEAMYLGFFALPIAAGALIGLRRVVWTMRPTGWLLFALWQAVIVGGTVFFQTQQRWTHTMPYIPQFVGASGLGPNDLWAGRPALITPTMLTWFTVACAASSLVLVLALCRQVRNGAVPKSRRAGAGMLLTIGLGQVAGVMPPSFHFRTWIISVDRYLLPLVPFAVCLGLWALRDVRVSLPLAWVVTAALAAFSIAGTRDFLTFQQATWDLAHYLNVVGVPNTRLDAGAAWDGYYLYEDSIANQIPQQSPGGPWWTNLFAPATDSTYVIAGSGRDGYDPVWQVEYSTWLNDDPTYLYLLRRQGWPGPP